MTPKFLHSISNKIKPIVLAKIFTVSILIDISLWVYFISQNNNKEVNQEWTFFIIALPHISVIWCVGLSILYFQFRKTPNINVRFTFRSIFITLWFLGLTTLSFVVLLLCILTGACFLLSMLYS